MNIGTLTGHIELEDNLSRPLDIAASHITQFANKFSGMEKVVLAGSATVVASIGGAITAIVALGQKGSVILGVEEAFDKMAQTVGSTGATMFDAMNEGLRGTVDSMEIMQSTTRLLSSGIKVSAADMGVMARTAREMAKATGGDAASSLNQLSTAVQTGNTRILKRIGINVDMVKAEKEFAASLGTTREQLSAAGVAQARANAIMEAFRDRLQKSGESALSFKERIQQANVAIGNWFDDLAKGVAKSSAVNQAFEKISKAFADTFGPASRSLLDFILKKVDEFANAIGRVGPVVIKALGGVVDWVVNTWNALVDFNDRYQITTSLLAGAQTAWGLLKTAFNLVKTAVEQLITAWQSMPDWLKRIAATAAQASITVAAFSVGVAAVASPVAALVSKVDVAVNIFSNFSGGIFAVLGLLDRFRGVTAASAAAQAAATTATAANTAATIANAGATTAATGAVTGLTIAQRVQAGVSLVLATSYNAVTVALVFWQGVAVNLAARIAMMNVVTRGATLINAGLTASYTALGAAMAFAGSSSLVLGTRMVVTNATMRATAVVNGITAASYNLISAAMTYLGGTSVVLAARMTAASIAARFAATGIAQLGVSAALTGVGMIALGTAIIAVPLIALAFALQQVWQAWKNMQKAFDDGKTFREFITAKDSDTWVRRWTNYFTQWAFGATVFETKMNSATDAIQRFKDKQKERDLADPMAELRDDMARLKSFDILGPPKQDFSLDADFLKGSTAAEEFAKKITDLGKTYANVAAGFSDNAAFEKAFKNLNAKTLAMPEVQLAVAPGIDKLIESGKQITPAMQAVRTAVQAADSALVEQGKTILESSGLTLSQIEHMKKLGLSETDIAHNYGVTTTALQKRSAAMQEAADNEARYQSFQAAYMDQQARDAKRREEMENAADEAIAASREELNDIIRRETMTTTAYEIDQIERQQVAREASFKGSDQQVRAFNEIQTRLSRQRVASLQIDNEAMKNNSKAALDAVALKAKNTYLAMAADPTQYSATTIREFKRISEAAAREADITRSVWVDVWADVKEILSNVPEMLADAFLQGGDLLSTFKSLGVQLANAITKPIMEQLTKAQKYAVSIGTSIGGAIGGAFGGATGATISGIASGIGGAAAAAGAFGTAIAGSTIAIAGVTAGIGAAAVGVYLLAKHFLGVSKEVKQTRADVAKFEDQLASTLTEAQKLEAGGERWKETTIAVRDAYLAVGKTVSQAESAVNALWDTGNPARARAASQEIAINVALSQNIKAVRQMVQEYVGAGTKIPPALQANIDKLVIMGKLTADNAAEMLKLTSTSVPAYADVAAAAERYGIVVETLGGQVQGLRITELANQVVADFAIMEAAGADMNVVMAGMKDEILAIITDAAKFGTALPAAMKPIIDRMDEAGYFTDEFGNKLVDVTKLTFAETLVEKIGKLVDAIMNLVDVIGGAGNALDELGNKVVQPQINPKVNMPDLPEPSTPNEQAPEYHSKGGIVGKTSFSMIPKGTDTVAAMLTPGERVLTVEENKRYETVSNRVINEGAVSMPNTDRGYGEPSYFAGPEKQSNVLAFQPREADAPRMAVPDRDISSERQIETTTIVELDSRVLTRATVKQTPGEVKRLRLGRHS